MFIVSTITYIKDVKKEQQNYEQYLENIKTSQSKSTSKGFFKKSFIIGVNIFFFCLFVLDYKKTKLNVGCRNKQTKCTFTCY